MQIIFSLNFSAASLVSHHHRAEASISKLCRNINMDLGVSLKQGPQLIKSVITLHCKNTSKGGRGGGECVAV